ncbi:MAG: hypothetical protein ACREV8_04100, partial [Gammaproteobacteria bacterium]
LAHGDLIGIARRAELDTFGLTIRRQATPIFDAADIVVFQRAALCPAMLAPLPNLCPLIISR